MKEQYSSAHKNTIIYGKYLAFYSLEMPYFARCDHFLLFLESYGSYVAILLL